MTEEDISSGLAPGNVSATLTVAGSALGNRSTPRLRNEKVPSTTSDMTSIVANTGRRTQSSDSTDCSLPGDGHGRAVRQGVDISNGYLIAGLDAAHDFDAI